MRILNLYMILIVILLIVIFFISWLLKQKKQIDIDIINETNIINIIKKYGIAFIFVNIFLNFKIIEDPSKWINIIALILSVLVALLFDRIQFKYIKYLIYLIYFLLLIAPYVHKSILFELARIYIFYLIFF